MYIEGSGCNASALNTTDSNLNPLRCDDLSNLHVFANPLSLGFLESELTKEEILKRMTPTTEAFLESDNRLQSIEHNVQTVAIPSEFLEGLHLNVKKETSRETIYSSEWLCDTNSDPNFRLKISENGKRGSRGGNSEGNEVKIKDAEKSKRRARIKTKTRQDYRERLRRKAECMREKRRKLCEEESEEQRLRRLTGDASKRREMRRYYESPDQRRKRLDAEAARKREYRMYNETPDERRKRLDREAEKRRAKRLTLYANETPEQRRDRLNRESAKRREARLNQYAKETDDQRRERLRRDASRAREMRFTRSAIESEEERRQRLVKDALRKRELRTHGAHSASNFTELQTVRSFEELNNVQMKEDPDNQLGGHYLSNWMMWFQNTLTQPVHVGEQTVEP